MPAEELGVGEVVARRMISHLKPSVLSPRPPLILLLLVVPAELFQHLEKLAEVDISGNPFDCGCDLLPLQDWLRTLPTTAYLLVLVLIAAAAEAAHVTGCLPPRW